jgi:hypothetical protein
MTELEILVRESLASAAHGKAAAPPNPDDLLSRAHGARTTRRRGALVAIAAAVVLVVSLAVFLPDRNDGSGMPVAGPSATAGTKSVPAGWKVITDSGLRIAVPPGTVVNPSTCPEDGRSYALTAGSPWCRTPNDRSFKQAPVVLRIYDNREHEAAPRPPFRLQTLDRDGLSGFVGPMLDPGFNPATRGATYTWSVVDNTTTTKIDLFGTDSATAQQVIDSLRLAR